VEEASVQGIRSAVTAMNEACKCLLRIEQETSETAESIVAKGPQSSHYRLKRQCDTRWVEKQSEVIVVREVFAAVVNALEDIADDHGYRDASGKAAMLLLAIVDGNFLVSMEVLHAVLQITKPLSEKLQATSQDLSQASLLIKDCVLILQAFREGDKFNRIFTKAEELHGNAIDMPQITSRQINRCHTPADTLK